jgi:hypothetical protein
MLTLFSIGDTPTSIDMPYGVTSEFILIFNIGGEENRTEHSDQSTSDEPTESLGIKIEYTTRAVVRLVNIFNCLACGWRSKMNERLHMAFGCS